MIEIRHRSPIVDERIMTSDAVAVVSASETLPDRPSAIADGGEALRRTAVAAWSNPGKVPLFRFVSIETQTGCNISCSFCPVGRSRDPRPAQQMSLATIENIAAQLGELGYTGSVLLFCNNEPLLDDRLVAIVERVRQMVPESRIKVLTNGTLLSESLLEELFAAGLTTLEIDNYTDNGRLIRPAATVVGNAEALRGHDIRINMRRLNERLLNRAGTSPNAEALTQPMRAFCALPFTDLTIVPDGRVTLCCFDALEQTSFGDVNTEPLLDIWCSPEFRRVRAHLLEKDRTATSLCQVCDYNGYRDTHPSQWAARSARSSHVLGPISS